MNLQNVGGTATGGSTVALSSGGIQGGVATFVTPDHAILSPRKITASINRPTTTKTDPGSSQTKWTVAVGDRAVEEGCCTVNMGGVYIDLNTRWNLNQDATLVDRALELARAVLFSPEYKAAILKNMLPST